MSLDVIVEAARQSDNGDGHNFKKSRLPAKGAILGVQTPSSLLLQPAGHSTNCGRFLY